MIVTMSKTLLIRPFVYNRLVRLMKTSSLKCCFRHSPFGAGSLKGTVIKHTFCVVILVILHGCSECGHTFVYDKLALLILNWRLG